MILFLSAIWLPRGNFGPVSRVPYLDVNQCVTKINQIAEPRLFFSDRKLIQSNSLLIQSCIKYHYCNSTNRKDLVAIAR